MLGSLRPQSPERKLKWGLIRQQLRQVSNNCIVFRDLLNRDSQGILANVD